MGSFEARLYIQGTAVYVPDRDTQHPRLRVLFPDQTEAEKAGLRRIDDQNSRFCDHKAVIEFEGSSLVDNRSRREWDQRSFANTWVTVDTDSQVETRLFSTEGKIAKLPHLPELLNESNDPRIRQFTNLVTLPSPGASNTETIVGGLVLTRGVLSAAAQYIGKFDFFETANAAARRLPPLEKFQDFSYASVLKVEFGIVEEFVLNLTPFEPDRPVEPLRFEPNTDELEVWVRHFCNVGKRPNPRALPPKAKSADEDFSLNYAFTDGLEQRMSNLSSSDLPHPRVSESWLHGAPVGGNPRKCAGVTVR